METNKSRKLIGNTALLGIIFAGALIFGMNVRVKSSKSRYSAALARALWKISSTQTPEDRYSELCWSWRKLVVCAVMISLLQTMLIVRFLSPQSTITYTVATFVALLVLLGILWVAYFLPSFNAEQNNALDNVSQKIAPVEGDTPEDSAATMAPGWAAKRRMDGGVDARLPVTIVTGFLGSGKTTLVKRILNNTIGMKILVIENEIGQEGIDHELLLQQNGKEEIILMNNGCICCTVRKDLLSVFHKLFADAAFAGLDWVVIETSGVADPSPLIQSLYMDDACKQRMRLDCVIAVVDSKHLPIHLQHAASGVGGIHDKVPEALQQISFGDRILMNKRDLVSDEEMQDLIQQVSRINSSAEIITCHHSDVPLAEILNVRAFDASRNRDLLNQDGGGARAQSEGGRDGTQSLIQVDASGKILRKRVSLNMPARAPSSSLSSAAAAVDGVAASASMFSGVSTVSLTTLLPLDLEALNDWLASILKDHGNDLYRLKGILSVKGFDRQFVAHGVHMLFDGELGPLWDDALTLSTSDDPTRDHASRQQGLPQGEKDIAAAEASGLTSAAAAARSANPVVKRKIKAKRSSRLVLIGRNLNADTLRKGFLKCCC